VAIISIFSGIFCHGSEVADAVAKRLKYEQIHEKLLTSTSKRYDIRRDRLVRTLKGSPPFFNKLTHERERNLAYLRLTLAKIIESDSVVCHGFAAHLLPESITHVLRVCLIADPSFRINEATKDGTLTVKDAKSAISKDDNERARWTRYLLGREPYEQDLYDILLPMHSTTVEEAVDSICRNAAKPAVRTTLKSKQAVADFVLAAEVNKVLAEDGQDVRVFCSNGDVSIIIKRYVSRLEAHQKRLESLAKQVPGVKSVRSSPGLEFVPPSLTRTLEVDIPSKILLVDDEREFVHTLSERLQTRNLDSAVVYDGEEALSFIEQDEPEVMVLDLKMPGIDGIEVLRRVKRDHPKIEVIILTGHGSEREERLARELGVFAYLQKPIDIDVLSQVMKDAYRKIEQSGSRSDAGDQ